MTAASGCRKILRLMTEPREALRWGTKLLENTLRPPSRTVQDCNASALAKRGPRSKLQTGNGKRTRLVCLHNFCCEHASAPKHFCNTSGSSQRFTHCGDATCAMLFHRLRPHIDEHALLHRRPDSTPTTFSSPRRMIGDQKPQC